MCVVIYIVLIFYPYSIVIFQETVVRAQAHSSVDGAFPRPRMQCAANFNVSLYVVYSVVCIVIVRCLLILNCVF